jgi:F-type H+-transporting ATPase subunit a
MGDVQISTDESIFWRWQAWPVVHLNATIVFTWLVMGILVLQSWLITRRLGREKAPSRGLEIGLLVLAGLLAVVGGTVLVMALAGRLADVWQVAGGLILGCGVVLALLVALAWLLTRRGPAESVISPGQNLLEVLVGAMRDQIREVSHQDPGAYLPFVGTLFLFIAMSNLLAVVPFYRPPTGSLATTAALATCVFVAVPLYGIASQGVFGYLRHYIRPTVLMLPFNVIGDLSRTLALAVRLYGNMMSGTVIAMILIGLAPLFFPILMSLLGLLTGMIQAYIFAVLAMVYIASATKVYRATDPQQASGQNQPAEDVADRKPPSNDHAKGDEHG